MLVLTRRPGEIIRIDLVEGVDPRTLARDLLTAIPIEIMVAAVKGSQVRLGIQADPRLRILREELCEPAWR